MNFRHGNNNTAEGNIFLGNDREGTGGLRIINEGNWVVNNLFYHCRGVDFRSPLAIMNGVPNSPAYRYLPVRDAVVANNTFINCTPFSLCEGSDSERSVAPANVFIFKNVFANNQDSILYHVFDKTDSIYFANNLVSKSVNQSLLEGFDKHTIDTSIAALQANPLSINHPKDILPEIFKEQTAHRLKNGFPSSAGFNDWGFYKEIINNPLSGMGIDWDNKNGRCGGFITFTKCATADDIYKALQDGKINIELTGKRYLFTTPISSPKGFSLSTQLKTPISFKTTKYLPALFIASGGSYASFSDLSIDARDCKVGNFISADTSGSCNHSKIETYNFSIQNLLANNFLLTPKYSISDEIIISDSHFKNNTCNLFSLDKETDNVGYYNVEFFRITACTFINNKGCILNLYRGGRDESTMGPKLEFDNNKVENCTNEDDLIKLFGVQISNIYLNTFINSNPNKTLISYGDNVRARHLLENNTFTNSGTIKKDKFVVDKDK